MSDEYFTMVFRGDIRKFDRNPMKMETAFGLPVSSSRTHALNDVEELHDEIERLTRQLVKFQWQPIADFVPGHDNPNVLVVDRGIVSEAYYNGESDNWWLANTSEHDFDHAEAIYPTHWMPLPAFSLPEGGK